MKLRLNVLMAIVLLAVQACSSITLPTSPTQPGGQTAIVGDTPVAGETSLAGETAAAGLTAAAGQTVETPAVAGETAAVAPTGETPATGASIPVTFENIAFVIPSGLATGATPQAMPAVGDQGAPWEIAPAHAKITLTGYPLQGTFFEPHILVYPAPAFSATNHPSAEQSLERLGGILAEADVPLNEEIPGVPMFNATKVFGSQIAKINFQNGTGVRLVTTYAQGVNPISNYDLMYQFQGLTSDGNYYIVANLPVSASFLAAQQDPSSPLPEGGIPFPDLNTADASQINAYFQAVAERLNATSPDSFQPTLAQLDALIQSIQVSP